MRIALIFILVSLILPANSFAIEPSFSEKEIETLNKKIDSLGKEYWGKGKTEKEIWEELKKPLLAPRRPLKLQSYEPNTLGYTWDKNDVGYMDFKLSLKYPIIHNGEYYKGIHRYYLPAPYIAFTGRFGQYIKSRKSSPVIGKRFNPKIFLRYWFGNEEDFFDFGAAHESNGQRIDTALAYQDLRTDFVNTGEDPDFANDYISRGWDYWDLALQKTFRQGEHKYSVYLNYKYFLKGGGLQGRPEEYNSWEGGDKGKKRRYVDGISVMLKYSNKFSDTCKGQKVALLYTTGNRKAFKYETVRFEFTQNIVTLPVTFWASEGYHSDLIDYYQSVKSYGIALELRNYLDQI